MNNMQATSKYHDGTKHSYWSIRNNPHNITKEVFMKQFTRRAILEKTALAAASAGSGLPLLSSEASSEPSSMSRTLKIIVSGGHPDDPESGCGGTIGLYSDLEHDVAMLYLTRGEAGIQGKSARETAAIRTAECQKACAILRARPILAAKLMAIPK